MNNQRGIVILFAVLTIGLLVGVGIAMGTLTQKQLILSNIGKQSQVAFYAADSGAECARYWDYNRGAFFTPIPNVTPITFPVIDITCNDAIPTNINRQGNTVSFQLTFSGTTANPAVSYNYCALVTLTKNLVTEQTTVISRGYNLPCAAQYSSRKVERAIQLTY